MVTKDQLPEDVAKYLDLEQLECMFGEDFENPPQEVVELLKNLLLDMRGAVHEIRAKWGASTHEEKAKSVHRLRGTIVNFGPFKACKLLEEVERILREKPENDMKESFEEAVEVLWKSVDLLEDIFPQLVAE